MRSSDANPDNLVDSVSEFNLLGRRRKRVALPLSSPQQQNFSLR